MIRYTTPSFVIRVNASSEDAEIIVSFVQGPIKIEKTADNVTKQNDSTVFSVLLSQEESAQFNSGQRVEMQVNIIYPDGSRAATNKRYIAIQENLLQRKINYTDRGDSGE